jgi:hypothetical protein
MANLNTLITLIMMVMEKNRDTALLMSMGARRRADPSRLHAAPKPTHLETKAASAVSRPRTENRGGDLVPNETPRKWGTG